jgi:hypothetical protein
MRSLNKQIYDEVLTQALVGEFDYANLGSEDFLIEKREEEKEALCPDVDLNHACYLAERVGLKHLEFRKNKEGKWIGKCGSIFYSNEGALDEREQLIYWRQVGETIPEVICKTILEMFKR